MVRHGKLSEAKQSFANDFLAVFERAASSRRDRTQRNCGQRVRSRGRHYDFCMKPDEKQLFEAFWDHVRRAEADIAVNGHKGCPPPDPVGDPWDDDFEAAYEAIRPFFRHLRKEHVFVPPLGMTWRATPMTTETAHQALMWFLNPPKEVYGHPGVLDTPEYLAIKAAAMEERRLRHEARQKASEQPVTARLGTEKKARLLLSFLRSDLRSRGEGGSVEPLTQEQISDAMTKKLGAGWSQPTIHRLMEFLFPYGGMNEYVRHCGLGEINQDGILNRNDDGTTDVDAISYDDDDD